MVSTPLNPVVQALWRKRLALTTVVLLQLLFIAAILSASFALAVVDSEEQSFAGLPVQQEDLENDADLESQQRVLPEGFVVSSPSLRASGMRRLAVGDDASRNSEMNSQQDQSSMSGQGGGWKNKYNYNGAMLRSRIAVPAATYAVPTAYAVPSAVAVPSATVAMPSTTFAMPSAAMSMPSSSMAMRSTTISLPSGSMGSATMAMPTATMAMPTATMAMPTSTVAVPYATVSMPTVAATPVAVEEVGPTEGYIGGGGIIQKLKALKYFLSLSKYAKYANNIGYNTYGTALANTYPLYTYQTPFTYAAYAGNGNGNNDYSGYNSYAGNNGYTGFSASTESTTTGLWGKKAKYTEEPGQRYLAQVISKNRNGWWFNNKASRLADVLGGVLPQGVDQPVLLSNGYETRESKFQLVLQKRERFVDLLVQDQVLQEEQSVQRQWIGRMYTEVQGQFSAIQALDRDFAIAKMAPQNEPLAAFRHSLRLDIPIDLFEITGLGTYVQATDGQVLLNAVSRRPLIRATAETVLANVGNTKKAYRALLSLSQQAVRAVANLNCLFMVHTNINPLSFLVTEKGLVFLGGLFQATQQGSSLADNYQFSLTTPVFIPPELRDNTAYYNSTAQASQDSWQLGMTLFTFWCSRLSVDSSGALSFTECISCIPEEIKDLILGLTQVDPATRLLAENVALSHPAMLLPIYPDVAPQADIYQDDGLYTDLF
ncbi:LOW QUALITY PROTEIN: Rhoptry kinase family protein ROP23 (incomplete catalytic triad), putative [Eimeria mitis]|uniref:Rhoptry kinase family protein ROP23 (Incomplete catalytic triad), putative n=1 Tax=Eimeria mitis TaxID=44415 RepID=U6K2E5_9EIME|nr:LOW QUALITY PROTEIN: Rhoptry kinase family protein ROP23 (incomplete catalytic triad), putative [Eimeria mitis]CDJ31171.1 Rhoptry kinase family protein ROP23 (incomplete catalytic triad), putative [Eimeria mitis]